MADSGIKQARLSILELPAINSELQGYDIRYRIVSEDKNRTSHWSPIILVKPEYTFVPDTIHISKQGDLASIAWDAVTINKIVGTTTYFIRKASEYDVWLRWDRGSNNGDWLYKQRLTSTSFSIPIPLTYTVNDVVQPSAPNRLSVEIYLKGTPIQRTDGAVGDPGVSFLKVYRLLNQTV